MRHSSMFAHSYGIVLVNDPHGIPKDSWRDYVPYFCGYFSSLTEPVPQPLMHTSVLRTHSLHVDKKPKFNNVYAMSYQGTSISLPRSA